MANFLRNIHPLLKRGRREDEYDNTNFAILNALNHELTQTERDTIQSKIHSSLETATGEYLDKWGDWFGVYRRPGQDDEAYRARIIRYLLLKRGTIPAIIDAIKDFLEDYDATVVIYEPWKNIFYTNKSALNGEDHLMGYYYRFAIIDISIDRPFPPEIREIIQAFKPAGVLFYVNYDGSLNPNNKPWLYPSATATVTSKYVTEFLTGITNNVYGKISMSEKSGEDTDSDYFITNDSDLNGADVLAGSFMHNRSYINLASSSIADSYEPTIGGTLSEIKLDTTELDDPFYMLTREEDGQFARVSIPEVPTEEELSNYYQYYTYDIGTILNKQYKTELEEIAGSTDPAETQTKENYAKLMLNPTISTSMKALVSPVDPLTYEVQIFDFISSTWHTVHTGNLVNKWDKQNVPIQSVIDYLNDNKLLYTRLAFYRKGVPVTLDVDVVNLDFRNKLANKFTISQQTTVTSDTVNLVSPSPDA